MVNHGTAIDDEELSEIFGALASAARRTILTRLAEGEASVNELAEPLAMSLPAVSKHIKVLEKAGLVERTRRAQFRPCKLRPEPLVAVSDWAETHRRLWEDRLTQLDEYVRTLRSDDTSPPACPPEPDPQQSSEQGEPS
jgi:DNA-binding transcriptional ArsR family regulator